MLAVRVAVPVNTSTRGPKVRRNERRAGHVDHAGMSPPVRATPGRARKQACACPQPHHLRIGQCTGMGLQLGLGAQPVDFLTATFNTSSFLHKKCRFPCGAAGGVWKTDTLPSGLSIAPVHSLPMELAALRWYTTQPRRAGMWRASHTCYLSELPGPAGVCHA